MIPAIDVYRNVLGKLQYESTTSITPSEFNDAAKWAIITFVELRHKLFESHQSITDALQVLKTEVELTPSIAGVINLPADYLHLTAVAAVVKYFGEPCITNGTLSDYIACLPLTDDEKELVLGKALSNYYTRPRAQFQRARYELRNNELRFHLGGSILQKARISYLRIPQFIELDDQENSIVNSEFSYPATADIEDLIVARHLGKAEEAKVQWQMIWNNQNLVTTGIPTGMPTQPINNG